METTYVALTVADTTTALQAMVDGTVQDVTVMVIALHHMYK